MGSETKHREQFEELSLLRSGVVKLCLYIIGSSQVMSPLCMRMWTTALHHAGVVGELTTVQAAVSSAVELVLGCSLGGTSWVEVMNKLTAKCQELEELCSRINGLVQGSAACSLDPCPTLPTGLIGWRRQPGDSRWQ
jgi:hypothetical protein